MVVGVHNVEITCTVKCYVAGEKQISLFCTATVTLEARVSTLACEEERDQPYWIRKIHMPITAFSSSPDGVLIRRLVGACELGGDHSR
jgi:hypothetical protein